MACINRKAALYGLALGLQNYKSERKSYEIFEKGYSIRQTIPKDLHIEALQEYAALLMDHKENKKALEVVQTALKISPTHRAMKDLFISLGLEDSSDVYCLDTDYDVDFCQHLQKNKKSANSHL